MSMLSGDSDSATIEDLVDALTDGADSWQAKTGQAIESLDSSLQAPNANDFSNARLIEELENRNSRVSGFRDQDVLTLQRILDEEFEREKATLIKQQREKKEQAAKQAGLQRRRMVLEKQLKEEILEIGKDHIMEFWLNLVKQNVSPRAARIEVNSITARALAKALWTNVSLTNLDISCNGIDDTAGTYIARVLKRNRTLVKISLGSNQLGASACRAFGESLCSNATLRCLNLESNPLTCNGEDLSGIKTLADTLGRNGTLTSLCLWRCALGSAAGVALSRGIESNSTLTFLEMGHNGITAFDQNKVNNALEDNSKRRQERQAVLRQERGIADNILAQESILQDRLHRERQLRSWLDQQKRVRAEERRNSEEKRFALQVTRETEADRILHERMEAERKAEAARLSKRKGKK